MCKTLLIVYFIVEKYEISIIFSHVFFVQSPFYEGFYFLGGGLRLHSSLLVCSVCYISIVLSYFSDL